MENLTYDLGTLVIAVVAVLFALANLNHILRRIFLLIRKRGKHTLTVSEDGGIWRVRPPKVEVKVLSKVTLKVEGNDVSAYFYFPKRIFNQKPIVVQAGGSKTKKVSLLAPYGSTPYYVEIKDEDNNVIAVARGENPPPEIEVDWM